MTYEEWFGIASYWVNSEKKKDPALGFGEEYEKFMDDLISLVIQKNPGISRREAAIRAVLISRTRGEAGLSRFKVDSLTACIMHELEKDD
jgi:hypothetical protein